MDATAGVLLSRSRDLWTGSSPVTMEDHRGHLNDVHRFFDIPTQGWSLIPSLCVWAGHSDLFLTQNKLAVTVCD